MGSCLEEIPKVQVHIHAEEEEMETHGVQQNEEKKREQSLNRMTHGMTRTNT